jgi:heat shock protein HtpX
MKIAAGLPFFPKISIIDDPAPNAFATGIKPEKSAIAVTAGLLSKLNRDELQGVVAHEMSHIINRDVLFMTFAGVMLGSIVMISQVFLRSMFYSSRSSRRYRSSSKGGGQAQLVLIIVAIVFAILAPILARLLYFAISRKREYLADASAVRLSRYPEGLASALEKISSSTLGLAVANKATAPMYIANPLKKEGMKLSNLTSTHPPISERIAILRSMMHGVNYSNYQKAFSKITNNVSAIIPPSALSETETVAMRKASLETKTKQTKKQRMRDVGDLMRAVNRYAFLACVCGLKIKIPPDFKRPKINCPRCKREHEIPMAQLAGAAAIISTTKEVKEKEAQKEPSVYTKKTKGWESFNCSCGRLLQLSPAFRATHILCRDCGKKTEIKAV